MQQLGHLRRLDHLLQDHGPALEVAARLGLLRAGHGVAAHVLAAVGIDRAGALGAWPERLGGAEVGQLAATFGLFVVAKVEFQLPVLPLGVEGQRQLGDEGPTGLGAKALQRPDAPVAQQGFGLGQLEGAPSGRLAKRKTAALAGLGSGFGRGRGRAGPGAGVAAVVFAHHAAAVGAGVAQGGVVAGHAVAVVLFGLAHHALSQVGDLAHEVGAAQLPALHQRQLVLPLTRQLGLAQLLHLQAAQQRHELERLGGGNDLAALAQQVVFAQQAFDDGGARGRRAQPLVGHGAAQFLVVEQLARAFHGPEQGGFVVARRGSGLQRLDRGLGGLHGFARLHRYQALALVAGLGAIGLVGGLFAIDRHPARLEQHLALGLEGVAGRRQVHGADAGRELKLGRRKKHRQKTPRHQVVELLLGLAQAAGRLQGGDDGKVVADLAVVEHALAGPDVALVECGARVRRQVRQLAGGEHGHGLLHRAQVVFRQGAAVGARVGQGLVPFVQALRQRQRGFGAEAKAPVGLALQAGEVVEQPAGLGAGLGFFAHLRRLAAHGGGDGLGGGGVPEAVGLELGVGGVASGFFEARVKPLAGVAAGLGIKAGVQLPVVAALEGADFFFALDHHRQRRRLHPAHGGEEKTAVAAVEGGQGAGAVDAHQPVGLGAAARGVGQRAHLRVAAQGAKAVADGLRRHRLQPQPLHRLAQPLGAASVLLDQPEDQLALAPGVAGVDQRRHVFALGQLDHSVEARLGFLDRPQVELRRDHRQVGKAPLAALDLVGLGGGDLHQVPHRRSDEVALVLVVLVVLVELARQRRQGAHQVLCDRGFFGDYQGFVAVARGHHLYNPFSCAHARPCMS